MAFPVNPVTGQLYTDVKGITYIFNNGAWLLQSTGSGLVGGDAAMIPMVAASLNAIGQQVSFNTVGAVLLGNGVSFSGTNITLAPGRWFLSSQVYLEPFTNTSGVIQFAWFRDGVEIPNSRDLNVPYTTTGAGSFVAQAHATVDLTAPAVFTLRVVSIAGTVSLQSANVSRVNIEKINAAAVGSFSPATALAAGGAGFVPAPMAGEDKMYLRGNGTFDNASPNTFDATVTYNTGDVVFYNTVEAIRTAPSGSGAFTWASWRPAFVDPLRWRGVWTNGTAYALGDEVAESATVEVTFRCILAHTSAASGTFQANVITAGGVDVNKWTPRFVPSTASFGQMVGSTATLAGRRGLVPPPAAGEQLEYLAGDGTFRGAFTGSSAGASGVMGLVPQPLLGEQFEFLRASGGFAVAGLITTRTFGPGTTNFTIQDGTRQLIVEVIGGGGGGGGAGATAAGRGSAGSGGGAGAYALVHIPNASGTYTATVGAGGAGGNGAAGGNGGGSSTFTGTNANISATGGNGGNFFSNLTQVAIANGPGGGTATVSAGTAIALANGSQGTPGVYFDANGGTSVVFSGRGGFSKGGASGSHSVIAGTTQAVGNNGENYGGGGSGAASCGGGGSAQGGTGGPGRIIVYEFS